MFFYKDWTNLNPVNIRNVLKWFKRLQNIFKTY